MERLLEIARCSEGAVFVVDPGRRIRYANAAAAELLQTDPREIEGTRCHRVVGGSDRYGNRYCAEHCPIFAMAHCGEAPRPFELQLRGGQWLRFDPLSVETDEGLALLYQLRPRRTPLLGETSDRLAQLSAREREILTLLGEGADTDTIAARLGIARVTVRNHVQRLLRKLGVHSKLEAVALALGRA